MSQFRSGILTPDQADNLNRLWLWYEAQNRADPTGWNTIMIDGVSKNINSDRPSFPAKITAYDSGTGFYSWSEASYTSSGGFEVMVGGRTGTHTQNPAKDRNGATIPSLPAYTTLTPGPEVSTGTLYYFDAITIPDASQTVSGKANLSEQTLGYGRKWFEQAGVRCNPSIQNIGIYFDSYTILPQYVSVLSTDLTGTVSIPFLGDYYAGLIAGELTSGTKVTAQETVSGEWDFSSGFWVGTNPGLTKTVQGIEFMGGLMTGGTFTGLTAVFGTSGVIAVTGGSVIDIAVGGVDTTRLADDAVTGDKILDGEAFKPGDTLDGGTF